MAESNSRKADRTGGERAAAVPGSGKHQRNGDELNRLLMRWHKHLRFAALSCC